MKTLQTSIVVLILTAVAIAQPIQSASKAPQHASPFLTKTSVFLIALDGGIKASDFYLTHENLQLANRYEMNPISRPFVTHGTAGQVAYFAGSFALDTT